ncbi:TPA: TIGR03756 family integrating conjugative element protein [Pasteurella multocida]|uniref:TIGR03756 family integrating conjugative element protein n=1 Tax=Actinobacillus equuli subsp. equuli TaxID=202947 RepID=A0A9X4G698_ACTEU|nr:MULTISPECIES: TIGR03756 family integrating conjugative element protein [Pasteurellaceae]MDE8035225.1 TIGR03756 family integrating conjugative element protein [Actinobacillus equuli subsp. equuli]QCA32164.1 TIGR03756 family integrating conjugative element protein [Pasteurella multocida]QXG51763.1 TIGR03756 family integrating conjugative element protein [Pasteurella multocida]WGE13648.1 TIGR03756 family integrating conjugative element protein [Pasteurella multocida]HDX0990415.1 TIGR03756 fami
MKFHRTLLAKLLSMVIVVSSIPVQASINSASIMASSASTSCLDYKVVGTCFWLFCTKFGCSIRTSTKVKHFLPEMVVSSYNHDGQNPWSEVSAFNQGALKGGEYRSPHKQYTQFTFKNADAIGHPQGAISQMLKSTGYYCQSQTTPFVPYFLSGLDFLAWKENLPEMFYPEAMVPGMREVSQAGDNWGNIYPRSGAINQVHDYKASAVIAQRVADIVSRMAQPHIYSPAAKRGGAGEWLPGPVEEGNARTHKWQMLYPKMERSCSVFPHGTPIDTHSEKMSTTGDYAWALWRPYSCCKRRGQTFLYSIDWQQ